MSLSRFQQPRSRRHENRHIVGKFRGGKLQPVHMLPVRGSESGFVTNQIAFKVDPLAGQLMSPAFKNPDADYSGSADVVRAKLETGAPLFDLEPENLISKLCRINPRRIDGRKYASEMVRLAHNCAVNHLRRAKYVNAG